MALSGNAYEMDRELRIADNNRRLGTYARSMEIYA
jgi:hypothetical protein